MKYQFFRLKPALSTNRKPAYDNYIGLGPELRGHKFPVLSIIEEPGIPGTSKKEIKWQLGIVVGKIAGVGERFDKAVENVRVVGRASPAFKGGPRRSGALINSGM